jgi:hypothetical protein
MVLAAVARASWPSVRTSSGEKPSDSKGVVLSPVEM